ncbi:MAG: right-handed parallel beta-helix repeat-containing protein [Pyrinomonadaceae bacterium MAG19_C2-C3]|nr:right-handed parallel beta-helix repeat-containing protein [Pyrinomonadaceae bacterium MAG19_C2-C3]
MKRKLESTSGVRGLVPLCLVAVFVIGCLACAGAQQRATDSASSRSTPRTIKLTAKDDLQRTINAARPGDTIVLPAGATFTGSFTLPDKGAGENWITFLSSDAALLSEGVRVTPSDAARMPKLVTPGRGEPVLRTQAGAHHYRFVGLEFTPASRAAVAHDLILFGDGSSAQTTLAQMPHHLVLDRCFVHGTTAGTMKRGVSLNSSQTTIVNSYFADFKAHGQDTQAIAGWNGSGNYLIENNYLEASGYPVMFGGSDVHVPDLVPSDIRILRNTFTRPLQWRAAGYTVKNLFELKSARRVTIDGNLFENNWQSGQDGTAIVFTVRDEDGRVPQATISDVFFINNIVRGSGSAMSIYGSEGKGGHRLTIANNLFEDIEGKKWGGNGGFLKITEWDGLVIENNTILTTGNITFAYGKPVTGFVFRNNIIPYNEYGLIGDGHAPGADSLDTYFPGNIFTNNAIIGGDAGKFKGRNAYPVSLKQMRFINMTNGNYRLAPDSPFRLAGAGGKPIGVDFDRRAEAKF